jgi:hypothetical protein
MFDADSATGLEVVHHRWTHRQRVMDNSSRILVV